MTPRSSIIKLCPWWARCIQRPDGLLMAYCSKDACDQMDKDRPGWRERMEGERQEECRFGFGEATARITPVVLVCRAGASNNEQVVWCLHLRKYSLSSMVKPAVMTNALWEQYVEAFLEFQVTGDTP
mgnify:CR=1 FL=1